MIRNHTFSILFSSLLAVVGAHDGRADMILFTSQSGEACTQSGAASCTTTLAAPPPVSNAPYVYATPSNGASWIAFNEGGWPGDLDVPVSTTTPFGYVRTTVSSTTQFSLTTYLLGDDYACFDIDNMRQVCTSNPGFQSGDEMIYSTILAPGSHSVEFDLYNVYPTGQGIYNETALAFSTVMAPAGAPPGTTSPEPGTAVFLLGTGAGLLILARCRRQSDV